MVHKKKESANCRKRFSVLEKKEIIAQHENGIRVSDIAKKYNVAKSTISTILKNKKAVKAATVAKGVNVISKQRSKVLEEVEKLLLIWIKEMQITKEIVTERAICEKAKCLYSDLQVKTPGTSADVQGFKASRGWFDRFRRRSGITQTDTAYYSEREKKTLIEGIAELKNEGYLLADCDENDHVWGKMPKRSFVIAEERELQECRTVKEEQQSLQGEQVSEKITSGQIKEICQKWNDVQEFIEKHHPNNVLANNAIHLMNENVISHFRKVLARKEGKSTSKRFMVPYQRRPEFDK